MATTFTAWNPQTATPGITAHKVTFLSGTRRVTFQASVGDIYVRQAGEVEGVAFSATDDALLVPQDGDVEMLLDRIVHGNPPSLWLQGSVGGAKVRITPEVR